MTTDRRSAYRLGAVLALGMFVAVGCNSTSPRTNGGSGDTGGSGSEDTGGKSGGDTGGKSGTGGKGTGGATGGASGDTGGKGGSGDTGGKGGAGDTGGAGGGGDTGGADGGKDAGADAAGGMGGKMDAGAKMDTKGAGGNQGLDPTGWPISNLTCDSPGLVWKTANKTHYTSYPVPGSEECIKYNGCFWQGKFNTCGDTLVKTKAWVMTHNIIALFPLKDMGLHTICVKSGSKTMEVVAYDTCGDSDCSGCCTANKSGADALIDFESYTDKKFGVGDGRIMWADLGYKGATCTDSP